MTVHQCPVNGSNTMPCCGQSPFGVSQYERMSTDSNLVTCEGLPNVAVEIVENHLRPLLEEIRETIRDIDILIELSGMTKEEQVLVGRSMINILDYVRDVRTAVRDRDM